MRKARERVLLVESDPEVSDLIARQTLQALGYQVQVERLASDAIQKCTRFAPDIIITNLNLPDLSGKDLMVALSSQGINAPVIIIAQKGMEKDMIQAFRLGATDYLIWPVREAEVASAIDRCLKQVRGKHAQENLTKQFKQTNFELQQRISELRAISAIGKALTSIIKQDVLFDKIVESAVYVTEADSGWMLIHEHQRKISTLVAQRNLPKTISDRMNRPWDDGISLLVALSGKTLSISGESLKRFKVSQLGQSVLIVPVEIKKKVAGLLVVISKKPTPFSPSKRILLEAIADFASISLFNAHLFRSIEKRSISLQKAAEASQISEYKEDEMIKSLQNDLSEPLKSAIESIDSLLLPEDSLSFETQKDIIKAALDKLQIVLNIVETIDQMN